MSLSLPPNPQPTDSCRKHIFPCTTMAQASADEDAINQLINQYNQFEDSFDMAAQAEHHRRIKQGAVVSTGRLGRRTKA